MLQMDVSYEPQIKTKKLLKELKILKIIYLSSFIFLLFLLSIFYFNLKSKFNASQIQIENLENEKIKLINEINQLKKGNSKLEQKNISIEN